MRLRLATLGIIIILLNLFTACAAPPESTTPAATAITDQLGRTVTLDDVPQCIVSLAPSNTEILFALGLGDRVAAVTDYCDYPPQAADKPSIGGFSTPNIEEIVALAPDLVLATSIHEAKVIPQLEGRGLNVLALNPKTVNQVLEAIDIVGKAAGVPDKAAGLVAGMRGRIDAVTEKTATLTPEQRLKTFYIVWHDPLMTAGAGTLQDELIALAGGSNIASGVSEYEDISLEAVIAADPEVIIAGAGHGSENDQTYLYAKEDERLRDIAARRNGRIHAVDADLASRPGPRIVDGLEQFAARIHPELFE